MCFALFGLVPFETAEREMFLNSPKLPFSEHGPLTFLMPAPFILYPSHLLRHIKATSHHIYGLFPR